MGVLDYVDSPSANLRGSYAHGQDRDPGEFVMNQKLGLPTSHAVGIGVCVVPVLTLHQRQVDFLQLTKIAKERSRFLNRMAISKYKRQT